MTETRPARTAARYGAVVVLAGALYHPWGSADRHHSRIRGYSRRHPAGKATVTISTEKWREGKLVLRGTGFTSTALRSRRSVRREVPRRPAG